MVRSARRPLQPHRGGHMRPIAFASVLVITAVAGCSSGPQDPDSDSDQAATGNAVSMIACPSNDSGPNCPTGQFAVTCQDGSHEVASSSEIRNDGVCVKSKRERLFITATYLADRLGTSIFCGVEADAAIVVKGI